jgi:hypothetical protein
LSEIRPRAKNEERHSSEGAGDPRFAEWIGTLRQRQHDVSFGLGELFNTAEEVITTEGSFGGCTSILDLADKYYKAPDQERNTKTDKDWRHVYRLMFAARMKETILKAGLPEPNTERQLRPLSRLDKLSTLSIPIMNELFRARDDCYSPFLGRRRRNLKLLA